MIPVGLALAAAWSWGFAAVLVRIGLRDISTQQGTVISLFSGLVFVGSIVFLFQGDEFASTSAEVFLLFALVGLLTFPIGRFFNYSSIGRLGVARATPILASSPLFAVALAVIFTGESVTAGTAIGIALVLFGVYLTVTADNA